MISIKKTLSAISLAALVALTPIQAHALQYTVKAGDFLSGIAASHGMSWQELQKANGLADPNLIHAGQTLTIPDGQSAPSPAPAAALTGCELARSLINQYDWDRNVAYLVMEAESGCDASAANMSDDHGSCVGSYGLFQVGCFWYAFYGYSLDQKYSADINVAMAHSIWQRNGSFSPWTTCAKVAGCV